MYKLNQHTKRNYPKLKMDIDYYGILNVPRNSCNNGIRKSYRKLAIASHPKRVNYPKHPGILPEPMKQFVEHLPSLSTAKFWYLLGEAFDVLSNDLLRKIYDLYGNEGLKSGVPMPDGYGHTQPYKYHGDPMKTFKHNMGTCSPYVDLIDVIFIAKTQDAKAKSPDKELRLDITLKEIYFGAKKDIQISRYEFVDAKKTKTQLKSAILNLTIPRGCLSGTTFKFPNEGDQSIDRIAANVLVRIADAKDDQYQRDGVHLYRYYHIDLWQALNGFIIYLDTIDDRKINIEITDIVDNGYIKTIPNEGLPYPDDNKRKGNLYLRFRIKFPHKLNDLISKFNIRHI